MDWALVALAWMLWLLVAQGRGRVEGGGTGGSGLPGRLGCLPRQLFSRGCRNQYE